MRVLVVSCFVIFVVFQIAVADNESNELATFEEVKDLPNHPEKYLVDVRTAAEVKYTGTIPGAIHIGFSALEEVLLTSNQDFASYYGVIKPPKDAVVIFFDQDGKYAQKASDLAKEMGWTKAKPYLGSFSEWYKREGRRQ